MLFADPTSKDLQSLTFREGFACCHPKLGEASVDAALVGGDFDRGHQRPIRPGDSGWSFNTTRAAISLVRLAMGIRVSTPLAPSARSQKWRSSPARTVATGARDGLRGEESRPEGRFQ